MKKIVTSLIILATYFSLRNIKYIYAYLIWSKEEWNALGTDIRVLLLIYSQLLIIFIVTALLFRSAPFKYLGLKKDIVPSFLMALLCTLPMIIGYGLKSGFVMDLNFATIHRAMIQAGFFEEVLFRGFLFGLLFYYCGWGFIPAVLIPSVMFAIGHLYQAENVTQSIGIFIFTFLANAGFAWFYVAWNSLWMPIFLHGFMDLAWDMFAIEANVMGDMYSNIFRFMTLGLAVFFSIKKVMNNKNFSFKDKLWINSINQP